jgi:hypothetical protein
MSEIHDNIIKSYCVDLENKNIIFNTFYDVTTAFECVFPYRYLPIILLNISFYVITNKFISHIAH